MAQHEIEHRRSAITALLRQESYLPLESVCRRFGISEATARRDLTALSRQKAIVRTLGGAMADYDRRFAPFAERLRVSAKAKSRIASAALKLIEPKMCVFLDAGTTVFAVAERLRRQPLPLKVVSNSLAIAERLGGLKQVEVHLLGGRFLPSQSVLLGPEACQAASRYRFDVALLGAEGFDEQGIWNSTPAVVALQQQVVRRARRHAICADASKAGIRAPALLMPWKQLDLLITNASEVPVGAAHVCRV